MKLAHIALTGLLIGTVSTVASGQARQDRRDAVATPALSPSRLPSIGTVSDRFLSYNVEMVELTGGRFWKPYASATATKGNLHEYRPPIDLTNARLRTLAAALGPAYVRYSGTWANATYFADTESHTGDAPVGYDSVLTRKQWREAVAFAKLTDAQIVTSMATSPGARDKDGLWQSDNAQRLIDYTHSLGGTIAASEFANEPNLIGGTKPPANYSAEKYLRDYGTFYDWMRKASPKTLILAPGAFEIGTAYKLPASFKLIGRDDLLVPNAFRPDGVSFHFYGGTSKRCMGTKEAEALTDPWLSSIDSAIADTRALRDKLASGAPLWLTETAETACGGNPWAQTFTDSFRFADQLARSARQGVQVYMHNTLAASDYALLDEHSFAPRPNYWVAYLWRRMMGSTVLDAGATRPEDGLRVYAHCQRDVPGGVTLLAINTDRQNSKPLAITGKGTLYSLTQMGDDTAQVALNGTPLALGENDALPTLKGQATGRRLSLPPGSINFITLPAAANAACRATKG
ncbi:hypothetical protein [Sphingobium sp. HWE2-09]|uniref:hypothetical protein n=1 Tax=Sphingobium sp. HWE2-09 TaxID=3108390 RepID=UPI002DC1A002|nr:hypothetical protein [Sphingobium sp. HWE2-09]